MNLDDLITIIDTKLEEETGLNRKVFAFLDLYNPLHFYCHMKQIGLKEEEAKEISKLYEINVYRKMMDYIKSIR